MSNFFVVRVAAISAECPKRGLRESIREYLERTICGGIRETSREIGEKIAAFSYDGKITLLEAMTLLKLGHELRERIEYTEAQALVHADMGKEVGVSGGFVVVEYQDGLSERVPYTFYEQMKAFNEVA